MSSEGSLNRIDDTALFVEERGEGPAVIVLHGGPGLDHHEFGDYLDPLADRFRLLLVDQRSQGRSEPASPATWTLERMAQDVIMLAHALRLERYAVFEPADVRQRVVDSWEREASVRTQEEFAQLMADQIPFDFADPLDRRITEYLDRTKDTVYASDVLRAFSAADYGSIELEDRLGVVASPTLILAGRYDRVCAPEASESMEKGVPEAELHIFERSGHMAFVEQPEEFIAVVRDFLVRNLAV